MINKDELLAFFVKLIFPAFVGVSIRLGILKKNKHKLTFFKVMLSYTVGIGSVYLAYPIIQEHVKEEFIPFFIATTSMSSEKIAEYLIIKWNADSFISALIEELRQSLIKIISKKE